MLKKINIWVLLSLLIIPLSHVSAVELTNPIRANSVPELVGSIISKTLTIVGSLALLMFIYGGFMWMLSGGNEKMVEKGKTTLMWAALGLAIIFMSYALVKFVFDSIGA